MELNDQILKYLDERKDEHIALLKELAAIPAPSHNEEKRVEFCKKWLEDAGCKGVYVDEALNVIYPIDCENKNEITAFFAHTDVVFPDVTPLPVVDDGTYIAAPGVGDDTAAVVAMMLVAKYIAQNGVTSKNGVVIVLNSCEEGLGNLKGTRQFFKDYEGRIKRFYSFDSASFKGYANRCVGSHRYELTFKTEGGHSYGKFGNRNAIHAMADLVCKLYECQVPVIDGSKTTYNVGIVSGGTSVNTIAQETTLLYEYRSDNVECLKIMQEFFEKTVEDARNRKTADIEVKTIGIRPCGEAEDKEEFEAMCRHVERTCKKHSGVECQGKSSSTDCNIPLSMGIPALTVPNYEGMGAHTREEKVLISSLPTGLRITADMILGYCD